MEGNGNDFVSLRTRLMKVATEALEARREAGRLAKKATDGTDNAAWCETHKILLNAQREVEQISAQLIDLAKKDPSLVNGGDGSIRAEIKTAWCAAGLITSDDLVPREKYQKIQRDRVDKRRGTPPAGPEAIEMLKPGAKDRGTATHFANWVFMITNPDYHRVEHDSVIADRLALGSFAHAQIDRLQSWMSATNVARDVSSSWELVYADPHDGSKSRTFCASRLIVDDKPMRCRPDVVFRDTRTGLIIILERKITRWRESDVPKNAWANVRVQLWSYGWIDEWADSPDVLLVCQFYRRHVDEVRMLLLGEFRQDKENPWVLNSDVRPCWRRSDRNFHHECLDYFSRYGGKFLQLG